MHFCISVVTAVVNSSRPSHYVAKTTIAMRDLNTQQTNNSDVFVYTSYTIGRVVADVEFSSKFCFHHSVHWEGCYEHWAECHAPKPRESPDPTDGCSSAPIRARQWL